MTDFLVGLLAGFAVGLPFLAVGIWLHRKTKH